MNRRSVPMLTSTIHRKAAPYVSIHHEQQRTAPMLVFTMNRRSAPLSAFNMYRRTVRVPHDESENNFYSCLISTSLENSFLI